MTKVQYDGPSILSLGLRPFFLAALIFGLVVVPLWWLTWRGQILLKGPFVPVDWHVHEMIFGYGAAVIAGFLFTAVPNWTGRMPKQGWPLVLLAVTWLAGRLAVAGILPLPAMAVAVLDCSFLLMVGVIFLIEVVAGRNWRNMKVVVPLGLLLAANGTFHGEVMSTGTANVAGRLGLAVIIFLITLIGGRIVPSFTRNWLAAHNAEHLPASFSRLDTVTLAIGALALALWAIYETGAVVACLLVPAGVLNLFRLARWRGWSAWRSPLLLMLHIAFAFVPLGMIAAAAGAATVISTAAGLHLLGIGAMGGMTLAVMIRATRGHTGRDLTAGPALTLAFGLVVAAALARAVIGHGNLAGVDGITLAAVLWTAAYGIASVRLGPWLIGQKSGRRIPRKPMAHSSG